MIQEQINRLVATLQALTLQRINALRSGNASEANQIQSVQVDIDAKIHELEKQLITHYVADTQRLTKAAPARLSP